MRVEPGIEVPLVESKADESQSRASMSANATQGQKCAMAKTYNFKWRLKPIQNQASMA